MGWILYSLMLVYFLKSSVDDIEDKEEGIFTFVFAVFWPLWILMLLVVGEEGITNWLNSSDKDE